MPLSSNEIEEANRQLLARLKVLEERIDSLEDGQERLQNAYSRSRASLRRMWIRPPMWTFEQHPPRPLNLSKFPLVPAMPSEIPKIAVVTPSFNHGRFLKDTIDSVLNQNYPRLFYHVQDGGSNDDTVGILKSYGDRVSWRSTSDSGQSEAINLGFDGVDSDIMAYLNSDDTLLPGTLAYVAGFFDRHPDVDVVYGHRVFIDNEGLEIGRAILPPHSKKALLYAGYIPQETMFWRRRVWTAIGSMDTRYHYALDWDFMLRAQEAGFKFARARRFMACFRVHDEQKTTKNYDVGRHEMRAIRTKYLGHAPSQAEIYSAMFPYLTAQLLLHWGYRAGMFKR
jgi:glycosyltransferase involved in cell wall biosynthesis